MTIEDWAKLKPDDIIMFTAGNNQTYPVILVLKDHAARWIVHHLNNRKEPTKTLVLPEKPELWRKVN